MLSFGIIAVFKVISLKQEMENFIGQVSFQSFSPQFPSTNASTKTPELVAMRG